MENKQQIEHILPEAYLPFAGYVIKTRALPDSRDCLKTGQRYILWQQYLMKNNCKKPRLKATDIVGQTMSWSPHGDSSIWGSLVRMGKPFALRYPLEDFKGNVGTMSRGNDHAASRYLEVRANNIAEEFYKLLSKETISVWKDNYTGTKQYPEVFPTLFPNFVNGNSGIGVGCISSIPQFNLSEVLTACEKIVLNPNVDYEEIYCAPDFATGAIITNGNRVKEVLKYGGKQDRDEKKTSIILRAVIEYDEIENSIVITELPYQVFATHVCEQISEKVNSGQLKGISGVRNATGRGGIKGLRIEIQLTKNANYKRVVTELYKQTSLQTSFPICCMMIDKGTQPRQFSLREMIDAYLNHMQDCIKKGYEFDLRQVQHKINILKGYLIAIAKIEEIIQIIKQSKNSSEASRKLIDEFSFNQEQAEAILNLKLQRLTSLEGVKIENELKEKLDIEQNLKNILTVPEIFKEKIIEQFKRLKKEFGDERRTKIINLVEDDNDVPVEKKQMVVNFTNLNNIYVFEDSTLVTQKKGGVGNKVKLEVNEFFNQTISDTNFNNLLVFSNKGKVYKVISDNLPLNKKTPIRTLLNFEDGEIINSVISDKGYDQNSYLLFVTKNGLVKKTKLSEYKNIKDKGLTAIKLKDGDSICKVFIIKDNEVLGIGTSEGYLVNFETNDINATGRNTMGVKGISLRSDDYVVDALIIKSDTKTIASITTCGSMKQTKIDEFNLGSRANKGIICHKILEKEKIAAYAATTSSDKEVLVSNNVSIIRFALSDVSTSGRNTHGTKTIKLKNNEFIKEMIII